MIYVKSEKEIDLMREPCKIVRDTLAFVGSKIQAGMSTKEVDELVERYIRAAGAYPSCLGYGGFPAATCISIDEQVVHGFPSNRIFQKLQVHYIVDIWQHLCVLNYCKNVGLNL